MGKEALMWEQADWNMMASSSNLGLGDWAFPMLSSLPLIPNIGLSVERKNQLSHFCRRVSHRCRNGPETV